MPTPRTRLVGRDAERTAARAALLDEASPVLTLIGTGGADKTRLALAIAHESAEHFADGIVWADLTSLADAALVPTAIALALDLSPAAGRPIAEQLARALRPRQTLLLLVNCEHVVAAVADLVFVLLAGLDDIQTALYSRIRAPVLDQMACSSASPSTACPTSQARPSASSTVERA